MSKIAIIGQDCAPSDWVYRNWADVIPNLTAFRKSGVWGFVKSTVPPITVLAWYSMFSGRTPGELEIYGVRNRTSCSYDSLEVANSFDIKAKAMKGWITINQFLEKEGFLRLRGSYKTGTRLTEELIEWKKTITWTECGHYSRIFINAKGRD